MSTTTKKSNWAALGEFRGGAQKFLQSNTLVAKFAIVILVLIGFVLLLRLGTEALQWVLSPTKSPYLIRGRKQNTKELTTIPQNPADGANAITLVRSANERYGIEFTYSCLLYTSPSPRDRQKSRMPSSA